ncbi:MAG TPA: hypothetical protein PLQ44_03045 [Candidatus Paceibacterota bacterium]|nr:hypothetical protein [Candidatus Paceibacterota bacterium]
MAKVTQPLMSGSASGKIGNNIVFFGWKGLNVVREWVKPANPESAGQGDARIIMGGVGRACGEVQVSSAYHAQLITKDVIPSGQTKQSYLVKYIRDHILLGSTTYASVLAELTAHTAYAQWGVSATALGLVPFDLDYASIAPFDKALGLYCLAKTAIALGFTGTPYTTALTAWVTTDVTGFVADITGL